MSSDLPGHDRARHTTTDDDTTRASRGSRAFAQRRQLTVRLLPLLPTDGLAAVSTPDLSRRLGLTGRDRDLLLWPILDRLTHAGLLHRIHQGRCRSWSRSPHLTVALELLQQRGNGDDTDAGLTLQPSDELTDTAIAALAWCGLTTPAPTAPASAGQLPSPNSPARRVAVVVGSHPGSRTRTLACATLEALTATGP